MPTHYDLIVIGTGAGGSTLVHRLAPSGKRILVIERGDFIPREADNWDPHAVVTQGKYAATETWGDGEGGELRPFTHYCVGGNTKVYGAALLRLREDDFGIVRHAGGVSPAWPITYADLEPYYTAAEELYTVHGRRGVDPLDPPAAAPYPFPALPHEPRIRELYDDLERLGYRPYPLPLGVRPHAARGEAPVHLSRFDGYPDPTETKADAHVVALRPALEHRSVELRTRTLVRRLLSSASGREIVGVEIDTDGEREVVRGDLVVVACGAINSAALLLRSASPRHPNGLANASDQVGRNYMAHHNGMLVAYGEAPNDARFQKTFGVGDFYRASARCDHPLGSVQLMGRVDLDTLGAMVREQLPGVRPEDVARHGLDVFLTAEDLPHPDNRVGIDSAGRVTLRYRPTNLPAYDGLRRSTEAMLTEADTARGRRRPTFLHLRLGPSSVSHQCGTLRMGLLARDSVVDPLGRAHDLDNLYVADGSVFPASGAVNPSLTIMAHALRVADHIAERTR
jgi:choline dehydrogenase-like flavoprotein